jgi:rhodanese-related sulfurtransferase
MFSNIFGASVPQITPEQAMARLQEDPKPMLLDVRQPEEFQAEHIAGARLIPLGDLPAKMSDLPRDREILVICASGSRSGVATRQLTTAGFQVKNIRGGMSNWSRAGLPIQHGTGR